jgi:hypothetical protein
MHLGRAEQVVRYPVQTTHRRDYINRSSPQTCLIGAPMARPSSRPIPLDLPADPDPDRMPIRYGDRNQLAEIYRRYYGPMEPRSLERWGLRWRFSNGRSVAEVREFLAEAERRFVDPPGVPRHRMSTAAA